MTILNDMQIRKLSLQPTHRWKGGPIAIVDNVVYFLQTGEARPIDWFEDINSAVKVESSLLKRMIAPFEPEQIRSVDGKKVISHGTSSMGYDVRLGNKFKIFTNLFNALIDPLNMPENAYVDHEGDYVIIPPNSYVLGHTMEYFCIPENITAICIGKSTYARAGCAVNITPIEPGFEGEVVIEVANQTPLPMKVYARMGIAQFLFFKGEPCQVSYATRNGKYQGQTGIQTAIV